MKQLFLKQCHSTFGRSHPKQHAIPRKSLWLVSKIHSLSQKSMDKTERKRSKQEFPSNVFLKKVIKVPLRLKIPKLLNVTGGF